MNQIGNEVSLKFSKIDLKSSQVQKLCLQSNNKVLIDGLYPNYQGNYEFNETLTIRNNSSLPKQLIINLTTENSQGEKKSIGQIVIKNIDEIKSQEINLQIKQCPDAQAYCIFTIDSYSNYSKHFDPESKNNDKQLNDKQLNDSNMVNYSQKVQINESRSQKFPIRKGKEGVNHHNTYYKSFIRSPVHNKKSYLSPRVGDATQNSQFRHKRNILRKQTETNRFQLNKRLTQQTIQNSYKTQVMTLKIKIQELQKSLNEKKSKNKTLLQSLNELRLKQLDYNYIKQDKQNYQYQVTLLQSMVNKLLQENQELNSKELQFITKIKNLNRKSKAQIRQYRSKLSVLESEYSVNIRNKEDIINEKNLEFDYKFDCIEKQKIIIQQMENNMHNRSLDYQNSIRKLKLQNEKKMKQQLNGFQQLKKNTIPLQKELQNQKQKNERLKGQIQKFESKIKMNEEIIGNLKNQLLQLNNLKSKCTDLGKEKLFLQQEKQNLQNQLKRTLKNKDIDYQDINKQYQQEISYYEKAKKQTDNEKAIIMAKVIKLQGVIEEGNNIQQKLKRYIENTKNQNKQLKDQLKQVKQILVSKQQLIYVYQNDLNPTSHQLKNSSQNVRSEIQAYRDEVDRIKNTLSSQTIRNLKLNQFNIQLEQELTKIRVELQYSLEKVDKNEEIVKDHKLKIDQLVDEYQYQIKEMNKIINRLQTSQKESNKKIKQYEQINIRYNEEKGNIKLLRQKLFISEELVEKRDKLIEEMLDGKARYQHKIEKLTIQYGELKQNYDGLEGEKNNTIKKMEVFQNQIKRYKARICDLENNIRQLEHNYDKYNGQGKKLRQDNTKLQCKINDLQRDYDRFKSNVMHTIKNQFTKLNQTQIRVKEDKVSNPDDSNDIINLLTSNCREMKNSSMLHEKAKSMQKNSSQLMEADINQGKFNHENRSQVVLHQEIRHLKDQLTDNCIEKQEDQINFRNFIAELQNKIRQKDRIIDNMTITLQKLQFEVDSMKLDFQANNEQNYSKVNTYKLTIIKLQQQKQYNLNNILNLQNKLYNVQQQLLKYKNNLEYEKEIIKNINNNIIELQENKNKLEKENYSIKKERKQLLEKTIQLEIYLTTQQQLYAKTKNLLQEQENKALQANQFIENIIKQKQKAIKSQLQKSQKINQLEKINSGLKKDKQLLSQSSQRTNKKIDQLKDSLKKINAKCKQYQNSFTGESSSFSKLSNKLKQKDADITAKDQLIYTLEAKIKQIMNLNDRKINNLSSQMNQKEGDLNFIINQLNDRICDLQRQNKDISRSYQKKTSELEKRIVVDKQRYEKIQITYSNKTQEIAQMTNEIIELKQLNEDLAKKLSDRQTKFNINTTHSDGGRKIIEGHKISNGRVHDSYKVNFQDNEQYQMIYEQYEEKIVIIEKQRDFYREKLQQKDQQIRKLMMSNTRIVWQNDDENNDKMYEEKIRRLQNERLTAIQAKNKQIIQLTEQNKLLLEKIHHKESEIRTIINEQGHNEEDIQELQNKCVQLEKKLQRNKNQYADQIRNLKKKEHSMINFKQMIGNKLWNTERQVRQIVHNLIKSILEQCNPQLSIKIMQLCKNFEQMISSVMVLHVQEHDRESKTVYTSHVSKYEFQN